MTIPSTLARVARMLSAMVFLVGSAQALTINFNTANSCFAANFGGTTCSLNPGAIQYQNAEGDIATLSFSQVPGTASGPGNLVSSNIGYGVFQLSYTPGQPGNTDLVAFGPATFLLNIVETSPSVIAYQTIVVTVGDSGDGTAPPVTGHVGPHSTDLELTFAPASVSYTVTTFSLVPSVQLLVDPTTSFGNTTIQGRIVGTVPEPASLGLLLTGLLSLTFLTRKKLVPQRALKS
jgi:hypothetical protein